MVETTAPRVAARRSSGRASQRRTERTIPGWEFWVWLVVFFIAQSPMQSLFDGSSPTGRASPEAAKPYFLMVQGLLTLFPMAMILVDLKRARELAMAAWPYLAFLGITTLFLATAQDMRWSAVRFALSFIVSLTAFGVCARLPSRTLVRCIVYTLVLSLALSIVAGIVLPAYAVTGHEDLYGEFNEQGTWRGIFAGKNLLGHAAGITFAVCIVSGRQAFGSRLLQLGAIALSLLCVYLARSASGVVISIALPVIYFALVVPRGTLRLVSIIFASIGATIAMLLQGTVTDSILTALGKRDTLTGRTNVWHVAQEFTAKYPLTGAGYNFSGSPEMAALLKRLFGVYSVHNTYLDCLVCLGWIGTAALGLAVVVGLWNAWRAPVPQQSENLRDLATIIIAGLSISGISETGSSLPNGLLALLFLTALFSLYKVGESRKRAA